MRKIQHFYIRTETLLLHFYYVNFKWLYNQTWQPQRMDFYFDMICGILKPEVALNREVLGEAAWSSLIQNFRQTYLTAVFRS